jgi:hypothetical protein
MSFKKYLPPRKRSDKPIVAIRRKQLQLNKKCQTFLKDAEFTELYFDEENKIIGIKPKNEETDDSIKINIYPRRSIAVIAASHFINYIAEISELDFDVRNSDGKKAGERSIQFIAEWDDQNKMITVKLKK